MPETSDTGFTPDEQELFRRLLRRRESGGPPARSAEIPAMPLTPPAERPLSAAQRRLWFLHRLDPDSPAYNMPAAFRIRGPLRPAVMARALAEVVSRHAVLRATFPEVEGRPFQAFLPPPDPSLRPALPLVDLSSLPPDIAAGEEMRHVASAAREPFDLARSPLLRAVLLRRGPEEHVVCCTLHHIACDGWSVAILVSELASLYAAFVAGRPSPLPPLPLQYADYAEDQERRLAGPARTALLSYWRQRLDQAPPAPHLPGIRLRAESSWRGVRLSQVLDDAVTHDLRSLARSCDTTLFTVLLAGLGVLLGRLSSQADLVIGAPVSGRDRIEAERLVGCFLNTLALRLDVSGEPTFRQLVERLAGRVGDDLAHQELPFELLPDEIQATRGPGRAPLFTVLLNFLSFPAAERAIEGLEVRRIAPAEEFAKLDLTFYAEPAGGSLRLDLVYDARRCDGGQMAHLLPQLAQVLRLAAGRPELRTGEISLVTPAAAALLPDPAAPLPRRASSPLLPRFSERAATAPGRAAILDGSGSWSYGELEARSAALAGQLLAAGLGRGDVVAVYGWRCGALAWALLGIMRAGAAWTVLDPAYPVERLAAMVRQCGPRGWLQLAEAGPPPRSLAELALALAGPRRLELSALGSHQDARPVANSTSCPLELRPGAALDQAGGEDLAYVAFTSGSTGHPKGILGEHRPLWHFLEWYAAEFRLSDQDRFAMLSGLAHDPLVRDVFTPLFLGGTLVVPAPEDLLEPGRLASWLSQHQVTIAHLTPSLGHVLAAGGAEAPPVPSLRYLCFGGESLPRRDLDRLRHLAPNAEMASFYGATETPQAMAFWRQAGAPLHEEEASVPLGRAIEGVQLVVAAPHGLPAGIGEPGEICVRTPYLSRGYLGDEELTRQRFATGVWSGLADDRLYRTGDLGRYLPDGQVQLLGRADRQLKVRGHRVEPAEVEGALQDYPGVQQALVTLRRSASGEPLLIAYVAADSRGPQAPPAAAELRAYLRGRLPEPLVPAGFVLLGALPLTPNGKVDEGALPPWQPEAEVRPPSDVTPRTAAERALAAIWAEVLGCAEVGAGDNFFALGGDSIRMVQVVALARRQALSISLRQFFQHPTVAELARVAAAVPVPGDAAAETEYELSPGQAGLLYPSLHSRAASLYVSRTSCRITGALDVAAFAGAWRHVLQRHPALRSSFRWQGLERPVQMVHGQVPLPVRLVDWSRLPAARREGLGDELLRELDGQRLLDPARAPLLLVLLVREDERHHRLVWLRHHLLLDGWSSGLVLREVVASYRALCQGGVPALPACRPLLDVIRWLRAQDREPARAFWRRRLAGFAGPTPLPFEPGAGSMPHRDGAATAKATLPLPASQEAALRALAGRSRVTLHTVLLTAWAVLSSRLSGETDVLFGTVVSGRPEEVPGVETIVGMLANPVPMRCQVRETDRASAWLTDLQERVAEMLSHSWLPLAEIHSLAEAPPGQRLFDSLLAVLNYPRGPEAAEVSGDLELTELASDEKPSLPLNLQVIDSRQGLLLHALFDPSALARTDAARLLGQLACLLGSLAADEEVPLGALAVLGEAERHQLAAGWNDTSLRWPGSPPTLPQMFAAAARRRPEAPAVRWREGEIRYGELDQASDRLAARLAGLGVATDTPVAVLAGRSPRLIVALLAILKAGGAYVPLDPDEPADRAAFMLAESAAPLLLAEPEPLRRRPDLHQALAAALGGGGGCLEMLDDALVAGGGEASRAAGARPQPDSLAYISFTSGSTGRPKGVAVPHRAVARLVGASGSYQLGPGEVVLQLAPLAFDASTLEIWGALATGGCLALPAAGQLSLGEVAAAIRRHGVTTLWLTAGLFHAMADRHLAALSPLRQLLAGGDTLSPAHVGRVLSAHPDLTLINGYGPTENTTFTTCHRMRGSSGVPAGAVPIGRPIAGSTAYLLDPALRLVPAGATGELYTGGEGLARGYHRRPDRTAERFLPDPFGAPGSRLYRTGDLARQRPDGSCEFLGRTDAQVKIRGFRVEPGEVESVLAAHPAIRQAAVVALRARSAEARLVAAVVTAPGSSPPDSELLAWLRQRLPEAMVPAAIHRLADLPLTANGKLDRRVLAARLAQPAAGAVPADAEAPAPPRVWPGETERLVTAVWRQVLGVETVRPDDNFFDLGGDSLKLMEVQDQLSSLLGREVPVVDLFEHTTPKSLAVHLGGAGAPPWADAGLPALAEAARRLAPGDVPETAIAVLAAVGRFPGAQDIQELWRNLCEGVESISFFTPEELIAAGMAADAAHHPALVRARGVLAGMDLLDAGFFGMTPRDAELTDPQHRVLLEASWTALEEAGYDPATYPGAIGVYAGGGANSYLLRNLLPHPGLLGTSGDLLVRIGNDKDFLTSRVSYKLGLRGPAVTLQTACSTSLVAVHFACQALLRGECDLALAGGVSVKPPPVGHLYQAGGIASPDGHCRAFSADARGTVGGDGVGVVVLKRLRAALADRDTILAVIRGSAINNDGAEKVGYSAPGLEGQAAVIRAAHQAAGVSPETIGFVEAHGTGTDFGDPIEVAALTRAFQAGGALWPGSCVLGAVKTNLGHLDAAAGVAGLIKAILALRHRQIPPTLHFSAPHPAIDFAAGPFHVNTHLAEWHPCKPGEALRAGVSSFGIGGTNAHVVLEEAPAPPASPGWRAGDRPWQLLVLSARTPAVLDEAGRRLGGWLADDGEHELADVAYTLQVGRRAFGHRRALVCRDHAEGARVLAGAEAGHLLSGQGEAVARAVAFLFPGQGAESLELGRGLCRDEPAFRTEVEDCCWSSAPHLDLDLRRILMPEGAGEEAAAAVELRRTAILQPALFIVEYALARLLMAWGILPQALLGHSLGEYVAACLAGVLSRDDALELVALRARLMEQQGGGSMVVLPLSEHEVTPLLAPGLSLAAVNAPRRVVVSGPRETVEGLIARLDEQGMACRRLATTHAFHSAMMEPVLEPFVERLRTIDLRPPEVPMLSNLTGTWLTADEATDPGYWALHLRGTVRFAEGVSVLLEEPCRLLLEVGPGETLSGLARQHPARRPDQPVLTTLGRGDDRGPTAALLAAVGRLWIAGAEVDWEAFQGETRRRRVRLPTYPFARQRHWVEPPAATVSHAARRADPAEWFYDLGWSRSDLPPPTGGRTTPGRWLIFVDDRGLGEQLAGLLEEAGANAVRVNRGEAWSRPAARRFTLDPLDRAGYERLFEALHATGEPPGTVVHLWSLDEPPASAESGLALSFHSLLGLAQALGRDASPSRLVVVTAGAQAVLTGEELHPEQAPAIALARVLRLELPRLRCRAVDLPAGALGEPWLAAALRAEAEALAGDERTQSVAYRAGQRWRPEIRRTTLQEGRDARQRLRPSGVYLVTGGLGGVGSALASALAAARSARLVLVTRTPLPTASPEAEDVRLRRLQALSEQAAEVIVEVADVTDREQMEAVVRRARERFGAIHGVIHAAGAPGGGLVLHRTAEQAAQVLAPKVRGTLLLAELLAPSELDFFVLCSSLESALASVGQADYCAANAFLDLFARAQASSFTIALGWDTWREAGMAVSTPVPEALREERAHSLSLGLSSQEGVEVFWRALAGGLPHVWVSTRDLAGRLVEHPVPRPDLTAAPLATAVTEPPAPRGEAWAPEIERRITRVWSEVLGIADAARDDNFFHLGGDSLLGLQLIERLSRELGEPLSPLLLFEAPTIATLAERLSGSRRPGVPTGRRYGPLPADPSASEDAIAIIGLAARLPGARNVDEFWRNLRDGVESIAFVSPEEALAVGVDRTTVEDPRYVRARPRIADPEWFDAAFFGLSPREAELTDPQHRVFLECAWEALESAGYDPAAYAGRIAVVAGGSPSSYLPNLLTNPEVVAGADPLQISVGNDKDALATGVSYRLNLRGPSLTIQTFCSTGLVAVHTARRLLLDGECDLALAGAVSIGPLTTRGYLYKEGGIVSPDGHCRAFDARAAGTVFGDGAGVVVLKRLAAARAEGDTVHAVIRGSAINNDGAQKAGFGAPSVEGQAEVVAAALANAGIESDSVGYVEAHGTGTPLGDPIEVAALNRVFATPGRRPGSCALGSVKTNVGHLDRAAGMASLIKAVLALAHATIPKSLHFEQPNPQIDFAGGPFFVSTATRPWERSNGPHRAGVTSLGFGGTNAHVVLEEAPPVAAPLAEPPAGPQLLVLSARSAAALERLCRSLGEHLERHPDLTLADVAYTCQVSRSRFPYRCFLVAHDIPGAAAALSSGATGLPGAGVGLAGPAVVLSLPAGDPAAVARFAGLLATEPLLRREIEVCRGLLRRRLDAAAMAAIEAIWSGRTDDGGPAARAAEGPAVCATELALARLWISWGVRPQGFAGDGTGELAAACLAGRLTVEEMLDLAFSAPLSRTERLGQGPAPLEIPNGAARLQLDLFDPLLLPELGPPRAADRELLLTALGQLWQYGVAPHWEALHGAGRRRLCLPTYPFERQRYWIPPPPGGTGPSQLEPPQRPALAALAPHADPAAWTYLPVWMPSLPALERIAGDAALAAGPWLLFCPPGGLERRLVTRLAAAGCRAVVARPGERFARLGPDAFVLPPCERAGYDGMLAALAGEGDLPRYVLHLWSLGSDLGDPLDLGFYSLLLLGQALGAKASDRPLSISVVTDGAVAVTGNEPIEPRKAAVAGVCQVLPKEYPWIRCVAVDVAWPAGGARQETELVESLIAEAAGDSPGGRVALRGPQRLTLGFAPAPLPPVADPQRARLRRHGVYLLVGGLGGLGLAVAEGLAREVGARLALVGRTPLPERGQWMQWLAEHGEDHPVSRKLRAILGLEGMGAEVLPLSADATDPAAMAEAVARTQRELGDLHGVIFAAGVAGGGLIQIKSPATAAQVLAAKLDGPPTLAAALAGCPLDFFVLFSSLESVLGSFGQADYCAANLTVEAFAQAYSRATGVPTMAIAWDAWQEVGMAAAARQQRAPLVHPLLAGPVLEARDRVVYRVELAGPAAWVITDHRLTDGRHLLPGTTYVELAHAIGARTFGSPTLEISELVFPTPLVTAAGEQPEVYAVARTREKEVDLAVISRANPAAHWREHAVCTLRPLTGPAPAGLDLDAVLARCPERRRHSPSGRLIYLGDRWSGIEAILHLGDDEGVARFELRPELAGDLAELPLHPALFDLAAGWGSFLAEGTFLPLSYGRIRIWRPLPRELFSYSRRTGEEMGGREALLSDLTLTAPDGSVVTEISQFVAKRVRQGTRIEATAASVARAGTATPGELLYADLAALGSVPAAADHGLRPSEGFEVLRRLLAGRLPAVVAVSTRDLPALLRDRSRPTPVAVAELPHTAASTHARPSLATPFLPPRSAAERIIAEIWERVLGIEGIGVDDNFFELGGDSMAGLQITAQATRAGLLFTAQRLFEHPTVAELALHAVAAAATAADNANSDAPGTAGKNPERAATLADFPEATLSPASFARLMTQVERSKPPA